MKKISPSEFTDFLAGPVATYFKFCREDRLDELPAVQLRFSIHDHVLSEAEYVSQPILYREFVKRGQRERYYDFECKVIDFFASLLPKMPILRHLDYNLLSDPYNKLPSEPVYFRYESRREFELLIPRALREASDELFLFPTERAIIESHYDLTWLIWLFEPASSIFEARLRQSGLHLI